IGVDPPLFEFCDTGAGLQVDTPLCVRPAEGRVLAFHSRDRGPDSSLSGLVRHPVVAWVVSAHCPALGLPNGPNDGFPNGPGRGARAALSAGFSCWPSDWSRPSAVSSRPTGAASGAVPPSGLLAWPAVRLAIPDRTGRCSGPLLLSGRLPPTRT